MMPDGSPSPEHYSEPAKQNNLNIDTAHAWFVSKWLLVVEVILWRGKFLLIFFSFSDFLRFRTLVIYHIRENNPPLGGKY